MQPKEAPMQSEEAPMQPKEAPMQPKEAPMQPKEAPMQPEGESKSLQEKKETPLARTSGEGGVALGGEDVDMKSDIQMPRLAILQGLSKMVMDGKSPAGYIANALTKEVFGKEFTFIPLFLFKTRAMFGEGRALVCSSRDAKICSFNSDGTHEPEEDCFECPDSKWPPKDAPNADKGPPCSLVYNYPVLNADNLKQFPVSISLMRTALKAGKALNSILMMSNEDWFSTKIKMTVTQKDSPKGTYFSPEFEVAGRTTDEEYALAKECFKRLRGKVIEVDLTVEAPENDDV